MNGGCSHLCFVVDVESKTLRCDCPDTMILHTDNKTCLPKDIPKTTLKCPENEYMCRGSKQCIPQRLICNGEKNCPFNDDEMNCVETKKPVAATVAPRTETKSSRKTLFIIIGASVGILVILVICVVIYCQYRKKSKRADMR